MRITRCFILIILLLSYSLSFSQNKCSQFIITDEQISNQYFELNGNWEFYDGVFFNSLNNQDFQSKCVEIPKLLSDQGFDSFGFGTLRTLIQFKGQNDLAIEIPDIYSAYKIFINGKLLSSKGIVGKTNKIAKPYRSKKMVPLNYDSEKIELVIQISNFSHYKYGISKPIKIGKYYEMRQNRLITIAFDIFLTGSLAMGSFFFLGLYYFGRKSSIGFYFALFCLTYAYRVIGWENFVLHELFPNYPWWISIRIEYISFYLSSLFFTQYTSHLFKEDFHAIIKNGFTYLSLIFVLLTLVLPSYWFTRIVGIYHVALAGMFVYTVYINVRATIKKSTNSGYALFGFIGIGIVYTLKTISYLGVIKEPFVITGLGQLLFFFFQGIILSKIFATSWKKAKETAEDSSRAKSDFLSIMSHEIRTPLNAIIGTVYHLIGDKPKPSHVGELNNLKNSSENLLSLINQILDFSKMEVGKVKLNNEGVIFEDFLIGIINPFKSLANKNGIKFYVNIDESIPKYIELDRARIIQIFTNLVGNALKFTDKGQIDINIQLLDQNNESIKLACSIQDTGIGIAKNMQSKIFGAFEQVNQTGNRKYEGTGLGLSITKNLLTLMGSTLNLQSKLGEGSTFSFEIELKVADQVINVLENIDEELFKDKRILLAEDNELNALIANRLLKKWGIQVVNAWNGVEAIEKCSNQHFDIILMDLQMPEMDGFEASKTLRERNITTPIIALTASSQTDGGNKLRISGIDGIITKPFKPQLLKAEISKHLQCDSTISK